MSFFSRLIQVITRDAGRAWRAGAGFMLISRWTNVSSLIVRRIVLARILGAENIGHIAVVNAVMGLIRLPAGAGTFPVVTKLVAEARDDQDMQKRVMGTSLRINAVMSAVVMVALLGILSFTPLIPDRVAAKFLYILVVFVPVIIYAGLLRCGLMGQRRMKAVAMIDSTVTLVGLAVVIPLAVVWAIQGWFLAYMISLVIEFSLFAWFLRSIFVFRWDREIAKRIGTIGVFSFLSQLLSVLILQFDTLTVSGMLHDPAATGVYNTAVVAVQQLIIIPSSILVVVFPFVAQNRDDMPRLRERYGELRRKLLLITVLMSVAAWIVCPWFFFLFGEEFAASTGPFRVLVAGLIARSLYILDNTYLEALGRTDVLFVVVLISTALVVGLNLVLIPRYGIMGAAWATTVSMFIGLLIRQIAVHYFIFHKQAIR